VIRADGGGTLLLPMDKAQVFSANLESHGRPLVSWQTYAMKRGETIDKVAAFQIAHRHQQQLCAR